MAALMSIPGTLGDFGLESLAGDFPVLQFVPSGPAFAAPNFVVAPRIKEVTPAADGSFTVDLIITEGLVPDAWYTLLIRWQREDGYAEFPGKLRIPVSGGTFQTILETSLASAYVIISETRPTAAFVFWFQPSTGDLFPWIGA